jgi:hypothetical protein
MGLYGLDRSGSRLESVEGSCEHGNEPSGSIIYCEILGVTAQQAASQVGLSSMELVTLYWRQGTFSVTQKLNF